MKKVYVIAELGINHNGNITLAKQLIDIAKVNGCDAVKLQKRCIEIVYTKEELNAPRESPFGKTNREQKNGLEFSISQYKELELYCKNKGLDFIVSCWDIKSLSEVEANLNVAYHKIASALITDERFLNALNETGKPIILSTGMSTNAEIAKAVFILKNVEYILACTSSYPTKDEDANLNNILTLKKQYPDKKIGFSNHSSGLMASFGATALGAECIEFHITVDRTLYGTDQPASIENVEVLLSGIRKMEILLGDGIKKVYDAELPIIKKLRKHS